MRYFRLFTILLVATGLIGCASGMKYSEFQPKMTSPSPDTGRIIFYRPAILGAAFRPDVMLNKEKVGEAIAQGFFYVDRPAGEYQVVTSTEVERKLSFVLDKGQTRYVRFSASIGFFAAHVYGELVEPSVGMQEIQDCKYTGKL
jgi:Protein of unknown function (DUF2846)